MLENELAQWAHRITFEDIDPSTVHILKRNVLDSYAGICASLEDAGMLAKFGRMANMAPAQEGISVWGIDQRVHESFALFMNANLGRRSDLVNSYVSPNRFGGCHLF
jgi:2-methylcitrate dehydratase